ncbi:hypothetical protein GCM10011586_39750 [Silvibacterium dinghuense]|nr:hypothetical protein GCM10011586_39750 [Silvibacterium dinghuense]
MLRQVYGEGQSRERCTKFVGNVLQEKPFGTEALLNALGHGIEVGRNLSNFVFTMGGDSQLHLSFTEGMQCVADAA